MTEYTYISLKEHFDAILNEREKAFLTSCRAHDRELELAKDELERRLEHLNELREEVTRDRATFVTGKELETVRDKISDLRGSMRVLIPLSAVIGGTVGALLMSFLK